MALATIADVEARLGRALTGGETSQATAWLVDASAMFVQRAVQKFEVSESTVRLFPRDGIVRLVQRPVIEIVSVTDIDGVEIDYTYDGHQSIYELGTYSPVIVNYDHGSADIPTMLLRLSPAWLFVLFWYQMTPRPVSNNKALAPLANHSQLGPLAGKC
jgi:hypothetical protein